MQNYQIQIDEFKELAELSIYSFVPLGETALSYTLNISEKLNEMRPLLYRERDEILKNVEDIAYKKEVKKELDSIIDKSVKHFMKEYMNKIAY